MEKMSKQDYLFKRKGSRYWQLRFKVPARGKEPARVIYQSTKRETYEAAMDWALPRILCHRKVIEESRAVQDIPVEAWAPATHDWEIISKTSAANGVPISKRSHYKPNQRIPRRYGGYTIVSKDCKTLVHYDDAGDVTGAEKNDYVYYHTDFTLDTREHREIRDLEKRIRDRNPELEDDLDERVIKAWIKAKGVPSDRERDVRNNAYAVLREVAPNRNFATYTPDDVRRLVQAWVASGRSTATMDKLRGHLRGMINTVIDNARKDLFPEIKSNPFVGDFITPGIKGRRHPPRLFSPEDHQLIMADLPSWPVSMQRLYLLGHCCGLRREECFTIKSEETRDGIRCMEICDDPNGPGKNGFANRLIPIPTRLLPYMPERIEGSLFQFSVHYTAKQMMVRIQAVLGAAGVKHNGKTHHSLRHGVETFLGKPKNGVHPKIVQAILGHVPDDLKGNQGDNQAIRARKSITYRYFHGNDAVDVLEALDKIAL